MELLYNFNNGCTYNNSSIDSNKHPNGVVKVSMNLAQTEKRLGELCSNHILYRNDTQYSMTPQFRNAMSKKAVQMRKADEALAVCIVDFFGEVNHPDLVEYIMIMNSFINLAELRSMLE